MLESVRFACRDDADNIVILAIAVADDQHSRGGTEAHDDEAVFVLRMVRVSDQQGMVVAEVLFRLCKRNTVLALVYGVLAFVPLEARA